MSAPSIWIVILAGGVGSRFWPVSTPGRPKQLLPLASDRSLIEETVERIRPLVPLERIRILTGQNLAPAFLKNVPDLGPEHLWVEPEAKGTAPALVWAAHEIARQDPEGVMISLHADHVIDPAEDFRALLSRAAHMADEFRKLFTIGVAPSRPETGYGYIQLGPEIASGAHEVESFVEKPSRDIAEQYLAEGGYLWNSGLFVWKVRDFLDEVQRHAVELTPHLKLLEEDDVHAFFHHVPSIAVDHAVLERSQRVGVTPATFRWDDVGAWDAVSRTRTPDEDGNVSAGEAHWIGSRNCIGWSEEGSRIVGFGVEDLVIVQAHGITFVAPRERAPDLKELLKQLPERLRDLS